MKIIKEPVLIYNHGCQKFEKKLAYITVGPLLMQPEPVVPSFAICNVRSQRFSDLETFLQQVRTVIKPPKNSDRYPPSTGAKFRR
jgi:hypothetical protein